MATEHLIEVRVRYDDADPMGYLHHSKYLTYFEMGRIELLRSYGGSHRAMEDAGLFAVVVKIDCHYHRPARYDDVLTISTRVAQVSAAKIVHTYRALREGELLATATITLALVNREGKIQRVPDWMKTPDNSS